MRIVQLTGHPICEDILDVELCAPTFRNGLPFNYSFLMIWSTVFTKNRTIAENLQLTGHGIDGYFRRRTLCPKLSYWFTQRTVVFLIQLLYKLHKKSKYFRNDCNLLIR